MSTRSTTSFVILLLIITGVVAGFWVGGFWTMPTPPIDATSQSSQSGHKAAPVEYPVLPGWCCKQAGGKCEAQSEGVIVCMRNGGKVFSLAQNDCDTVCTKL
jgi:hypothetical protein